MHRYWYHHRKRLKWHRSKTGEVQRIPRHRRILCWKQNTDFNFSVWLKSSDDTGTIVAWKWQIFDSPIVCDATSLFQQCRHRIFQDTETSTSQSEFDGNAIGYGQREFHQCAAHGFHRRLDQLDVFGFRDDKSTIPIDTTLQTDASTRRWISITRRSMGFIGFVVFPKCIWFEKHLHTGPRRE